MVKKGFKKSKMVSFTPLILALLFAVACGTAAEPDTSPPDAVAPAPTVVVAAPTAAAQPVAPAPEVMAEATVHQGKLTVMVGDLALERFDVAFVGGAPGGNNYGRLLHGFLISNNENKEMVPGIASEWSLSADGLTWNFTIRKGVKFHDGSELTPQDVVWSQQHYFGPEAFEWTSHSNAVRISQAMESIETSGPDTVRLTTKEPITDLAVFISEAGDAWFHVLPARSEIRDTAVEEAYDESPVGAGPMSLVKHTRGYVMEFDRFDDYYYQPANGFPLDKRMKFQSLDMFLVPEEATRVAAIRAGEADIAPATLGSKKQVEAGGGRLVFGREGTYVDVRMLGCWVNTEAGAPKYPCSDRRVRQALDFAIDKQLIRDRLFGPEVFEIKGWSVITPSTIGYTPELDPRPFDPDKARQLLADAGYPGGEGFGKLIVNTWPSTAMPFQVELAQLASEFWTRELGLDVEVRVGDSTGIKEKERSGELSGQILWRENEARIDASGKMSGDYGGRHKGVRRMHDDEALFATVQEAFNIVDPEQKAEASRQLYQVLREEGYMPGIGYVNIPWAVGSRVLTWQPEPLSLHPSALHTVTLK